MNSANENEDLTGGPAQPEQPTRAPAPAGPAHDGPAHDGPAHDGPAHDGGAPEEGLDELHLLRYLDDRLNPRERAEIEERLKHDPAARRTLDALREEERLLRAALEPRVEASRRLGDKVLMVLHQEERFRLNAERNRRLRRQFLGLMGAAATVVLCLWLAKPREAAGSALSGTVATLTTSSGETHALNRNGTVYEGDTIATARGQFVRVGLAGGVVLDIDEHSRVEFERGSGDALALAAGRIGIDAGGSRQDVVVRLPQGRVRIAAGSIVDLWLPTPKTMQWPAVLADSPAGEQKAQEKEAAEEKRVQNNLAAAVTIIQGSAYATTERYPEGLALGAGQRTIFTASSRASRKVDIAGSRVLEARGGNSWHGSDGSGPRDRIMIGLLSLPSFTEMGRCLKLSQKPLAGLNEALAELDAAAREAQPALRARKFAAGQLKLRQACGPLLDTGDEGYHIGRMLEGLAHIQRGRALIAAGQPDYANASFSAASVAFDEARQPFAVPGQSLPAKPKKPAWPNALNVNGATLSLLELAPSDQSDLLASFYHAVSDYWRARTSGDPGEAAELAALAAKEFQNLRADPDNPAFEPLGRSVETLAALLGEGLALELGGEWQKASDVLQDLASTSLAGISPEPCRQADGMRQAALAALARLYASNGDMQKARTAASDFWLLYPLAGQSAAAREIDRALRDGLLRKADAALKAGQYSAAVDCLDDLSATQQPALDLRFKLARALVGAKSGDRARQELEALAPLVPQSRRAEFDALQKEARALPSAATTRENAGLPSLPR